MTLPRSRALLRALTSSFAVALAAALVALVAAPGAPAARARARFNSCDVSQLAGRLGTTTVTSLKVQGARCERGISVVRAFHACRLENGPSGRCVRLVRGYACGEQRTNSPTQFNATATCRKRRATVVHRYTQTL